MYLKGTKIRPVDIDDLFIEGKVGIVAKTETCDNRMGYIVSFQGTEIWLDKDHVRPCFPKDEYDYPIPLFNPGDRVYVLDWLSDDMIYGTVVNSFHNDRNNQVEYYIRFDNEDKIHEVQEESLCFIPVVSDEFKELIGV